MMANIAVQSMIIAASLLQGFLSMGFQLVATRVIAPFFGSTLIVWAFVISTFLGAFSIGAILGGACSRLTAPNIQRSMRAIGIAGAAGFVITAELGHPLLVVIDRYVQSLPVGLGLACVALFLGPVIALSAMLPIFTEILVKRGNKSGLSTGLIYGMSTIGNIFGVMATAFLLIPRLHTSTLLVGWAISAAACFCLFYLVVRMILAYQQAIEPFRLEAREALPSAPLDSADPSG
jgi:MFS family permease